MSYQNKILPADDADCKKWSQTWTKIDDSLCLHDIFYWLYNDNRTLSDLNHELKKKVFYHTEHQIEMFSQRGCISAAGQP